MVALALAAAALDAPPTSLQPLDPAPCAGVLDTLFNASALPDRAAWRAAIHAAQHPPDCASAPLCTCGKVRADGSRVHGQTTSELHADASCLLRSVVEGCTLVAASEPAAPPAEAEAAACVGAHGVAPCYLQRLGACSAADGAAAPRVLASPQRIADVRALCGAARARWGVADTLACFGEVAAYVARPAEAVRRAVHELAAALALGDCAGRVPLNATVAVHVRHGDKLLYHTDGNTDAHAALALAHATARGLRAVHFMSDSLAARAVFAAHLQRSGNETLTVRAVPEALQVFTGESNLSAHRQFVAAPAAAMDQEVLLLAETILMAQSDVLVGPQVSNVDRLVAELMASLRERPVVDDVDNVTWFDRRGGVY